MSLEAHGEICQLRGRCGSAHRACGGGGGHRSRGGVGRRAVNVLCAEEAEDDDTIHFEHNEISGDEEAEEDIGLQGLAFGTGPSKGLWRGAGEPAFKGE